jgi:hypothetical protein
MKHLIISAILVCGTVLAVAQDFNTYFEDATLRIDYFHIGNAETEYVTVDQIYRYNVWSGHRAHLLDNFNQGRYYVKVYDPDTEELIYSKGFDSYFGEYKTSDDALKGIMRTYHETALIPFPKKTVQFVLELRDRQQELQPIFERMIDPLDISIHSETPDDRDVDIIKAMPSGEPSKKVDVVILSEGYTRWEKEKFRRDLQRFTRVFFEQEPYKSLQSRFNVYGVFKPSRDTGVDEPRAGIYKTTELGCTFNSLGSERYLLTEDNKAVRDLASHVPYDAIYIMVNHKRYGGGGIYNFYCTFTADNQWHEYLFLHEFGHSFAGLADEYYTSSSAYNEFYPRGQEPIEPNITALLDAPEVKWADLTDGSIEIPTPWEKEAYDKMDYAWQEQRRQLNDRTAELKRTGAAANDIRLAENEYDDKDRAHAIKVDSYLRGSKYYGQVGAFEGAGYSAEGLYRPMIDCIMFSKGQKPFCKVCNRAIIEVINHYSE